MQSSVKQEFWKRLNLPSFYPRAPDDASRSMPKNDLERTSPEAARIFYQSLQPSAFKPRIIPTTIRIMTIATSGLFKLAPTALKPAL